MMTFFLLLSIATAFQLPPHLTNRDNRRPVTVIDPDYCWINRYTGIIPTWTSGIGYWQHYDVTQLQSAAAPVPYTAGYMRKHLRMVNATAFELWSVYQPQATGGWLQGLMSHSRHDGNWDHSYLFKKTPYRINYNPLPNLPDGSTTRVFLVQPGHATVHGTMKLPTVDESEAHQGPNWQFFEFWLGETYRGRPEGRKVGAVVEFHGLSGCLNQLFLIHEIAEGEAKQHPKDDINFETDASIPASFPTVDTRIPKQSPSYPSKSRVVNLINGPLGPEHVFDTTGPLLDTTQPLAELSSSHHSLLEFVDQGAYLKIPKCFGSDLNGDVVLEFGCRRLDGTCHRLVVYGNRRQGYCYHTICYDEWSDDDDDDQRGDL